MIVYELFKITKVVLYKSYDAAPIVIPAASVLLILTKGTLNWKEEKHLI